MAIPFTRWYNETPDLSSLLAFCTKGFVFQYRLETTRGKKFLPRRLFGIFVGMESSTTLYRTLILTLQSYQTCRRNDSTILKKNTPVPSLHTLTSSISQHLIEKEGECLSEEVSEPDILHQCFFTHFNKSPIHFEGSRSV